MHSIMGSLKKIFFATAAFALVAPAITFAAPIGATHENPLQKDTVDAVVTDILGALQNTIVFLAIVFIVIGGILYIFSAGDERRISLAKGAFLAAIIGLVIGVAAPSLLKEIYSILNAGDSPSAEVNQAASLAVIAVRTLDFLLGIAGTVALIALVIGGIMYLTGGGDESRVDTGKKIFKSAIIGIIIVMISLVVVRTIAGFFTAGAGGAAAGGGNQAGNVAGANDTAVTFPGTTANNTTSTTNNSTNNGLDTLNSMNGNSDLNGG